MIVKVYAKSAVDLHGKVGAYAFILDGITEKFGKKDKFKNTVATLAQADCAAYVNALYFLSTMVCAPEITEIHLYSDSGVVIALLEVYKAQKHCEELCTRWREKIRPVFTKLQGIRFMKLDSGKVKAGDNDMLRLRDCKAKADGELYIMTNLTQ